VLVVLRAARRLAACAAGALDASPAAAHNTATRRRWPTATAAAAAWGGCDRLGAAGSRLCLLLVMLVIMVIMAVVMLLVLVRGASACAIAAAAGCTLLPAAPLVPGPVAHRNQRLPQHVRPPQPLGAVVFRAAPPLLWRAWLAGAASAGGPRVGAAAAVLAQRIRVTRHVGPWAAGTRSMGTAGRLLRGLTGGMASPVASSSCACEARSANRRGARAKTRYLGRPAGNMHSCAFLTRTRFTWPPAVPSLGGLRGMA
jgi:hypothetical protein